MEPIHIVVYGEAQTAGSKKAFLHKHTKQLIVTDDNSKSRGWMNLVAREAGITVGPRLHGELLTGPVALEVTFYEPRRKGHYGTGRNEGVVKHSAPLYPATRPDATKLLRAVEDALTGVVWRDDGQVVDQVVRKRYGAPARCEIVVTPHALATVGEAAQADQLALAA